MSISSSALAAAPVGGGSVLGVTNGVEVPMQVLCGFVCDATSSDMHDLVAEVSLGFGCDAIVLANNGQVLTRPTGWLPDDGISNIWTPDSTL